MNRRKFEQHLSEHGCRLQRNGGGHDVWRNARGDKCMPVPRHTEIKQGLVERICRHFGIAKPKFK